MGFELPHRGKTQLEETKAEQRESGKTRECHGGVTSIQCPFLGAQFKDQRTGTNISRTLQSLTSLGETNACMFLRRAMNSLTVFDLIFRIFCFEAGSHIAQATMEPNGAKVSRGFLSLLPLPPRVLGL